MRMKLFSQYTFLQMQYCYARKLACHLAICEGKKWKSNKRLERDFAEGDTVKVQPPSEWRRWRFARLTVENIAHKNKNE